MRTPKVCSTRVVGAWKRRPVLLVNRRSSRKPWPCMKVSTCAREASLAEAVSMSVTGSCSEPTCRPSNVAPATRGMSDPVRSTPAGVTVAVAVGAAVVVGVAVVLGAEVAVTVALAVGVIVLSMVAVAPGATVSVAMLLGVGLEVGVEFGRGLAAGVAVGAAAEAAVGETAAVAV